MTLEDVEKAAGQLIQFAPRRGSLEVEENLRELQGTVLEYADWLHLAEHERALVLLAKFEYLLMLATVANQLFGQSYTNSAIAGSEDTGKLWWNQLTGCEPQQ